MLQRRINLIETDRLNKKRDEWGRKIDDQLCQVAFQGDAKLYEQFRDHLIDLIRIKGSPLTNREIYALANPVGGFIRSFSRNQRGLPGTAISMICSAMEDPDGSRPYEWWLECLQIEGRADAAAILPNAE